MSKLAKFLEGIGSILCLFPKENKRGISLPISPINDALNNDWKEIGLDMWKAYRTIESQQLSMNYNNKDKNGQFERSPRQYF